MSFYKFDSTEKETIDSNEKYFSFFAKIPTILFWLIFATGCLIGLIIGTNTDNFARLFLPIIIGFLSGLVSYVISKLALSYYILHIYCLVVVKEDVEKIKKNLMEINLKMTDKD